MKCKEIKKYLNRYQDGELELSLRPAVENHLEGCQACRRESAVMDAVTARLKARDIEPLSNFTAQVMGRVNRSTQKRWFTLPSFVYSMVFILFCLLGLLLNPNLKSPGPRDAPETTQILAESNLSDSYADLLAESQKLTLLEVQEGTLDIVYDGEPAGGNNEF